jgi:hypothetical protein
MNFMITCMINISNSKTKFNIYTKVLKVKWRTIQKTIKKFLKMSLNFTLSKSRSELKIGVKNLKKNL